MTNPNLCAERLTLAPQRTVTRVDVGHLNPAQQLEIVAAWRCFFRRYRDLLQASPVSTVVAGVST
jgi:hypothetical protein